MTNEEIVCRALAVQYQRGWPNDIHGDLYDKEEYKNFIDNNWKLFIEPAKQLLEALKLLPGQETPWIEVNLSCLTELPDDAMLVRRALRKAFPDHRISVLETGTGRAYAQACSDTVTDSEVLQVVGQTLMGYYKLLPQEHMAE